MINGVAHCFFDNEEDRAYALGGIYALMVPPQQPVILDTGIEKEYESERKIAQGIAQLFKKKERFSGQLNEGIHESF